MPFDGDGRWVCVIIFEESSKNAHNKGKKPEGEKAEEQGMSATRKGMTHINNIAGPVIILNRQ
uniref:Uncharacterized protein n=1 Tax=Oryza rufipogon TaxID=4529 RepID=A0A0E0N6Q3_ORYRU